MSADLGWFPPWDAPPLVEMWRGAAAGTYSLGDYVAPPLMAILTYAQFYAVANTDYAELTMEGPDFELITVFKLQAPVDGNELLQWRGLAYMSSEFPNELTIVGGAGVLMYGYVVPSQGALPLPYTP